MKINSSPKLFLRQNRLFGWLGILLLAYTFADATVLQYYGGNETLGISYSQVVASGNQKFRAGEKDANPSLIKTSEQSVPDQQPELPTNHRDCICSCSHVLVSDCHVDTSHLAVIYERQVNLFFRKFPFTESHLSSDFHPPRLA